MSAPPDVELERALEALQLGKDPATPEKRAPMRRPFQTINYNNSGSSNSLFAKSKLDTLHNDSGTGLSLDPPTPPKKLPQDAVLPPSKKSVGSSASSSCSSSSSSGKKKAKSELKKKLGLLFQDEEEVNFKEKIKTFPHSEKLFIQAKKVMSASKLHRPIGLALLPGCRVAVACSGADKVAILNTGDGKPVLTLDAGLRRPSDMVALPDGRLVVRDDTGLTVFNSEDGQELGKLGVGKLKRCFGMASDGKGLVFTVQQIGGETDVVQLDVETGTVLKTTSLTDVVDDQTRSKCRFLHLKGKRLYITDLGLDQIYVMKISTDEVFLLGQRGSGPGQFVDPAGVAVDSSGDILVADAGNHRLMLFDKRRRYVCKVFVDGAQLRRPSGIAFDASEGALYVLNLKSDSLVKYKLE